MKWQDRSAILCKGVIGNDTVVGDIFGGNLWHHLRSLVHV